MPTFQPWDHGSNSSTWLFFILQQYFLFSNCKNLGHPINLFSTISLTFGQIGQIGQVSFWEFGKDCSSKFRSKHSTNTVLCLLQKLLEQSLYPKCDGWK